MPSQTLLFFEISLLGRIWEKQGNVLVTLAKCDTSDLKKALDAETDQLWFPL